jgi:hypothetical protein
MTGARTRSAGTSTTTGKKRKKSAVSANGPSVMDVTGISTRMEKICG